MAGASNRTVGELEFRISRPEPIYGIWFIWVQDLTLFFLVQSSNNVGMLELSLMSLELTPMSLGVQLDDGVPEYKAYLAE
ncbi:MAG: hypothetical protein KUG54_01485 [Gammaproteobacteria bacterium]|nr:hypothetical protein [Gammaproteobacteria bacterium]